MSIKQALLAGQVVVGVGNIYASESLFRARIHPAQPAGEVTRAQAVRLVTAIVQTLTDALASRAAPCATMSTPPASLARTSPFTRQSTKKTISPVGFVTPKSNASFKASGQPTFARVASGHANHPQNSNA